MILLCTVAGSTHRSTLVHPGKVDMATKVCLALLFAATVDCVSITVTVVMTSWEFFAFFL